ncbi:MAG: hypothetical protein LBH47_03440 [Christensenellaceae bacterium]|nr:hypothetical protein [Christensenellaceae bacterium]
MWCLLIVGIMALLNRFGKVFNWLAAGTAYIGIIGALVTILGEPYLDSQEAWGSWYLIKSAVSHTILLLGCVYILAGKFVKIRVHGVIPTFVLGLVYGVIGFIDILIFAAIDHDTNPMYIKEPIKSGMEPLYGWMLLIISVVIVFIFTSVWELCFYKKDERFYKNFHAEELF